VADSFWDESVKQEGVLEQKTKRKEYEILNKVLRYWYLPLIVLVLVLLSKTLAFLILMAMLVGLAVLVSCYRFVLKRNLGIEVVSFLSITTSMAINPLAGALVAVASVAIIDHIHRRRMRFRNARLIVYGGLCFLVGFFEPAGVAWTGIMLVLLRNAIFIIMTFFHNAQQLMPGLSKVGINIAVNAWLFIKLGEWMVGLLQ
jgi:hypothetical protein